MSRVSALEACLPRPRCLSARCRHRRERPGQGRCTCCIAKRKPLSLSHMRSQQRWCSLCLKDSTERKPVLKRRAQPASYGRCGPTEIDQKPQFILKCGESWVVSLSTELCRGKKTSSSSALCCASPDSGQKSTGRSLLYEPCVGHCGAAPQGRMKHPRAKAFILLAETSQRF